ncbi:DUF262 domain-containing protein [Rhodococcus sp. PAM 2766]|uniref:DUF262 domain-containing protein n=1 Tax=Rhodococcus parequi TaxID=3137122 RepID=A0ABW9FF07_9NOCA
MKSDFNPEPPGEFEELDDQDENSASSEQAEALDLTVEERKLVTQPYDLGVRSLSEDIRQGRISLTIEYQRKYVWDSGKASRLIESLLLNVPIPVCYFAEDDDGVYEVIDGLQRLSTIRNYLNDEFSLNGISVLSELEGKRFSELAPRDQRRLEGRTIRCIVITADSHPDIKFDVFERLNTGAATLTAQELRNSVYRGPFNMQLKELASEEYFTDLVGTFSNKRMDLEELILRFFALVEGVADYRPPLRQFLNSYMRANRKSVIDDASVNLFRECCTTVHGVLGSSPFRMPGSRTAVNKALFDAIMVPVAFSDRGQVVANAASVRNFISELPENESFRTSIGRATADRFRMLHRISVVADGLRDLGISVDLPDNLGLDS